MSLRTDILDFARAKFGKRRTTFPTPVLDDTIILEKFTGRQGMKLPKYGDAHPNFPGATLCHRTDTEGDDNQKVVTLVYASERASQETYNYAITYGEDSNSAEIYTRTYILPRATYEPLPKLSDDNPCAPTGRLLVKEEVMGSTGDKELDSQFIKVVRVFETLPGPALTGAMVDGGTFGAKGATVTQTVEPGTVEPAAGINVVSSRVTPLSTTKSRLETTTAPFSSTSATLKDYDERGDPIAREQTWVDPSSTPPAESATVRVRREMETKDRARQLKDTATRTPLVSKEFGEFGGTKTETSSIVAPSTVPVNTGATIQRLKHLRKGEAELLSIVYAVGVVTSEVDKAELGIPGARAYRDTYLVLASSTMPADTATETYERRRFPENEQLKVEIKTTYAKPDDYFEIVDMGMAFPTLFHSYYSDEHQGTTIKQRSGYSVNVPHEIWNHFDWSEECPEAYQIIENELTLFSVNLRGLMDADTITKVVNGVSYSQSVPASTPSRSEYEANIGRAIAVGGSSKIWRAGIYHTQRISVIAQ